MIVCVRYVLVMRRVSGAGAPYGIGGVNISHKDAEFRVFSRDWSDDLNHVSFRSLIYESDTCQPEIKALK
ncbi:hypothetical protein ABEB36_015337 [Hypothenemus hampei]|uniref:Uncharacterized protein n=1 Tax=Hypothenemus hampei TaxID=57062 RepID=A0ABD1DZX0_HYPHA